MYRFYRDRLFWAASGAYLANGAAKAFSGEMPHWFLKNYFNDLLLIPCALPPLLSLHLILGLRHTDGTPTASEVAFHLLIWCLFFEFLGPSVMRQGVSDPIDCVCYAAGGIAALLYWQGRHFGAVRDVSA